MIHVHKRKIWICVLLSIITFGIYYVYWQYLLLKNVKAINKDETKCTKEMLCLIFVPLYPIYWWFTRGKIVRDRAAEAGCSVAGNENAYLLLNIFKLNIISMAIMQNDFNSLPVQFAQEIRRKKMTTRELTTASILTAIVFVLQYFGATIRFGTFSISTVLIPIVIGAATCGVWVAAWLGFVFGIAVLASGDASPFLAVSVHGTIITVLLKGVGCGLIAGIVYKLIRKISNEYLAVISSAIVCPIVNTGVFLLGCTVFFMDTVSEWAASAGWQGSMGEYMIIAFVGVNFLVEMGINIFFTPIIVRLLKIKK